MMFDIPLSFLFPLHTKWKVSFLHKFLKQNIPSTSLLFSLSFCFSLYPDGGPGFSLISCTKIDIKYANSCIKVSSDCRIYRLGVCVHAYRSSVHVHTSLLGGWVEASPVLSHWKSDNPKTNVWWLFLMYGGVNKQHGNNWSFFFLLIQIYLDNPLY